MLLQQLVNGLMLGSTYALIAIGYALIFGVLGLVHLAHGEVFMMGALIGLQLVLWLHAGPAVALVGALLGTAVLGMIIELTAFRPIRARHGPVFAPMVSTIGVGLILQEVATKIFGGEQVGFPHRLEPVTWRVGPITISSVQLLILGVSVALMVALHLWVTRTRMGMAMRASAESTLTARLLGISTDRVILVTSEVHMRRSLGVFRAVGLPAIPAVSKDSTVDDPDWTMVLLPSDKALRLSALIAHELVGTLYYWLRGWYA